MIFVIVSILLITSIYSNENVIIEKLVHSINITKTILISIEKRWDIYNYPLFLKSVAMSVTSWNILKLKYQQKIVNKFLHSNSSSNNFVISFMGSSVTGGKDRHINYSFPSLIGPIMKDAFESIGITLEVRNVAMANNPCLPYDLCVKTFCGFDSDIIQWEQSYNCDVNDDSLQYTHIFEQFLRQSIVNKKNHPVIVFSESDTPNWSEADCKNITTNRRLEDNKNIFSQSSQFDKYIHRSDLTKLEKELLSMLYMSPQKIATALNKDNLREWSSITPILKEYKTLGIQLWNHKYYSQYKCHGPYVPNWDCCDGYNWHPSILGHQLRASHYSYFWLLIYLEALESIYQSIHHNSMDINTLHHIINKHIYQEIKFIPHSPIYASNFSDNLKCFTSFIPIYEKSKNLLDLIVPSITPLKSSFDLMDIDKLYMVPYEYADIYKYEYKDRKNVIYGNVTSSPLYLYANVTQKGYIHICQAPSVWGKIPNGFVHLWMSNSIFSMSYNITDTYNILDQIQESLIDLSFIPISNDVLNQCIRSLTMIDHGNHILKISPKNESNIMIAYLLLP